MQHFRAFGGVLRSALHFPELRAIAPAPPDWTLSVGAPAPTPDDAELLGAQRYPGDVEVRLLRCGGWVRVETSDIGDFDLRWPTDRVRGGADHGRDARGLEIVWRRPGEPTRADDETWARFDLLGRVLPIALHLAGRLALHGSSFVSPDGRAVALLAPKGRGKSTIALAVAQRGGLLLSDDVTVLDPAPGEWLAYPGVHSVRLWDDAAHGLGVDAYGVLGAVGRKRVVQGVPDALRAEAPAPLGAVYLLTGSAPADGAVAARRLLGRRDAALALVRQATAGALLGGEGGARLLDQAAGVVQCVPVYALDVAYDFARLDELVAALVAWPHRVAAGGGAGPGGAAPGRSAP